MLKFTDESERLVLQCRGRVSAACSECEILLVMLSTVLVLVLVTPSPVSAGLPHHSVVRCASLLSRAAVFQKLYDTRPLTPRPILLCPRSLGSGSVLCIIIAVTRVCKSSWLGAWQQPWRVGTNFPSLWGLTLASLSSNRQPSNVSQWC